MTHDSLTPYATLADLLDRLPQLLSDFRRSHGLTLREAAGQAGVSHSTIKRIEGGHGTNINVAAKVLRWMDLRRRVAHSSTGLL